jgi:uncharacterized protein YggU (UPF0235/DUF167 family)
VRLTIRVHPRSRRAAVGGEHDGALVVRVRAAPEGGRANEEALRAVAAALGVPRTAVSLRSGGTGRTKVVDVVGEEGALARAAAGLRAGPATP